ncbi:DUF4403 family protein [Sphingomonas hylomeconis]|uniref:DUF4403 family protein n=1 Tax=Sphingomonas hylomeconis TaxID=1395958 RepID=A0ABV7SU44_9SPHN|nr:DUF4403 family protein [Sphingomonas hylomeconis]
MLAARALPLLLLALAVAACSRDKGNPAPPRIETPAVLPQQSSTIVVPVSASLAALEQQFNARTPTELWRIDKAEPRCVPGKRVKLFGRAVKVTPTLGCRIVGRVTRGRMRLGGSGDTLTIALPVKAEISARDVGGIIGRETATGAALVRATAKLSVDGRWAPVAKVDIAYDWTEPPGIDFLGARIRFADKADEKLKGVIAGLERDLPRELAKLRARDELAGIWRQAFTSIQLNRDRPPAWMRLTPRRLGFGGYRIAGGRIELQLAAEALTETFVGDRPADPTPTALPPPAGRIGPRGLRFFIPVLADYAQLEPVVQRALRKLAAKGITLTGVGPVDAEFGKVTIYATEHGHIAVGVQTRVKARNGLLPATKGEIWLSALPFNAANSKVVRARDVKIAGRSDSTAVNLLITLFDDTVVQANIRDALTHDFARDYNKVLIAARRAVAGHREGDFVLSADITDVRNGPIKVTGQGLFLPVQVTGTANIRFAPGR